MMTKLLVGLAVFTIATPVGLAAAQEVETDPALVQPVSPPPTTPCAGCGPSGTVGDGSRIWGYVEHHCVAARNVAEYSATYGVGRDYPNPVQFWAQTGEQTGFPRQLPDVKLALVDPGDEITTYPVLAVPPGASVEVNVFGIDTVTGQRPQFYDGTTVKSRVLLCPCDVPTPPTTTPAGGGGGGGVGPAPTTVPPVVTGKPIARRVPTRVGSSAPATLPATGSSTPTIALVGAVLLGLGLITVRATRPVKA